MRFLIGLATIALTVLIAPTSAAYAVPLLPPLAPGVGDGILPGNDDGSSSSIPMGAAFPGGLTFFGGPYTQMFVNNNGNITFNEALGTYTPAAFPMATQPMIAPYWADVDTRGGGGPANNSVFWHLAPGRMLITWHNVGYYSMGDELKMDFQLVITSAVDAELGDFDAEFRYNRCEWEAGNASGGSGGFGGTPAQAGFDAGNGLDYVEIPGSRMPGIAARLCTASNVGEPGIWRFGIRGGGVVCPGAGVSCALGGLGPCGVGVTRCAGTETICAPMAAPAAERCDGVDNDCNGLVDDGLGPCIDAGVFPVLDGGILVDAGLGTSFDAGPDAGHSATDAGADGPAHGTPYLTRYGCGCTVPSGAPISEGVLSSLGVLVALAYRRLRRRRAEARSLRR